MNAGLLTVIDIVTGVDRATGDARNDLAITGGTTPVSVPLAAAPTPALAVVTWLVVLR